MYLLKGVVQHYSWGGYEFIPLLLGIENTEHIPFAEYWLGAHPNHPSVIADKEIQLDSFIEKYSDDMLGEKVSRKFSSLPYLFKVLDVRQMLSIQVHPSKESAQMGYEKEDKEGISLKAPHRNYKDKNHKPELMVALSDFWLLHGFKSVKKIGKILNEVQELRFLLPVFEQKGYKGLYEKVMEMRQEEVNNILDPLLKRVIPLYEKNKLIKSQEDFWAARAAGTFSRENNIDRGIFSIYLFNVLHLKRGEGIYQPAGMPHAYLEGQNIEVMANSDNVLRAGLTDKHIDVPELMNHVVFEETIPDVLHQSSSVEKHFHSPAEEFVLSQYELEKDIPLNIHSTSGEIWFVTEGDMKVQANENNMNLSRGQGIFVSSGTSVKLLPATKSELFRVSVP